MRMVKCCRSVAPGRKELHGGRLAYKSGVMVMTDYEMLMIVLAIAALLLAALKHK